MSRCVEINGKLYFLAFQLAVPLELSRARIRVRLHFEVQNSEKPVPLSLEQTRRGCCSATCS